MTLMQEPVTSERNEELLEHPIDVKRPPVEPVGRIRWFEWTMAVVLVAVVALMATILMTQPNEPEADSTLVLGPRHFGVVFVPEYVGASGGDLVAIESSPLVLGDRQLEGFAYLPEWVGQSGGDLPVTESSPLVIGPRQIDGVVYVPVFVGHADGVYPESAR